MKKLIVLLLFFCFSAVPAMAQDVGQDERIDSYQVLIRANADASVDVRETILYNFGSNERHGIYRDIPIIYKTKSGRKVKLDLENIIVTDGFNNPYIFSTREISNNKQIKIGDPNSYITGLHTYVISYRVPDAVGFFDDFDEIYWNAVGTKWEVPIYNADVTVEVPGDMVTQYACYAGASGSNQKCDSAAELGVSNSGLTSSVRFWQATLGSREGFTVAVGFPKGLVVEPPASSRIFKSVVNNWWFIIPIIVFVLMYRRWKKYGKDPKGTGVIVTQYGPPEDLSPMQIAFILKHSFGLGASLSAEIVYLATHGFLKISKTTRKVIFAPVNDYELEKLKEADETLKPFQARLLGGLFSSLGTMENKIKISDLRRHFHVIARKIEEDCELSLINGGYFPDTKDHRISGPLRSKMVIISFSIFLNFLVGMFVGILAGAQAFFALTLSIIIWTVFRIIMPRMTEKGVLTKEYIKGFKTYLSVAEKDRLAFHNAPERNPEQFEKMLPYAIALGVEREWAKVFEGINIPPPTWYSDPSITSFNAGAFATSVLSFAAAGGASLSSSPGSSSGSGGGGSSGGGGGGGGGGSW